MRAHEVAHQIDHLLMMADVVPTDRPFIIDFIRSGYDSVTGEYQERTISQNVELHCVDCPDREKCKEDCPIKKLQDEE